MAVADMFLKLDGVTGETSDTDHKGEIEVVSWRWGMGTAVGGGTGDRAGSAPSISELEITKHVDRSSVTLMSFLASNREVAKAQLTARKAGGAAHEYLKIELENVLVTALNHETKGPEIAETITLNFTRFRVTYTPQGATGAAGGGAVTFQYDIAAARGGA